MILWQGILVLKFDFFKQMMLDERIQHQACRIKHPTSNITYFHAKYFSLDNLF